MTQMLIEARDPLVVRDGRPNDGRSESRTLDFPLPSTIVGAIRTALGRSAGDFDSGLVPALLERVRLRGPLLVRDDELLAPAPADALVLERAEGSLVVHALRPIDLPEQACTSSVGANRTLVGLPPDQAEQGKPWSQAPRFWRWQALETWLETPGTREGDSARRLLDGGLRSLERNERVHVGMSTLGTAEEGRLFVTTGLCAQSLDEHERVVSNRFLVDVEIGEGLGSVPVGLRPLGGERRLARWSKVGENDAALGTALARPFDLPGWLARHVDTDADVEVRVMLLTPMYVESSLGPRALEVPGVATIVAARVDKPRTLSGWNMASNAAPGGAPKKTRNFAQAGTIYWVRLAGTKQQKRVWLDTIWMKNIGDDPQLCRDGFGLAVVGIGRQS